MRLLIEGFAIVHVSRKTRNNARLLRPPGFDCGVAKVGPKPRGSKFRGLIAGLRRLNINPGSLCLRVGWGKFQKNELLFLFRSPGLSKSNKPRGSFFTL